MQIKPETRTNSSATSACGNCGVEERRLLHHVRHRGCFRRLCTSCVLRLHPQSFCPTCFQVYSPIASNDAVISCFKCYSNAHSHCVQVGPASTPSPYICPLCVNPNTPIFKLKTAKEANVDVGECMNLKSDECRVMDRDAAKKLLAAAKIASASMNKAADAAKAESERRAKEAALARKRAKEALEHVAYLDFKEKSRKNEAEMPGSVVRGVIGVSQVKSENYANVESIHRNGIVTSNGDPVVVEEKTNAVENMDRVTNPNQVLEALNAVELREIEKLGGITAQCAKSGVPVNDDSSKMDEDEKGGTTVNAGENVGGFVREKNNGSHVLIPDIESHAGAVNMQGKKKEETNNGVVFITPLSDKMHNKENGNSGEPHANGDQT